MSLDADEIITRLQAQGITAAQCPACGRVREVQEDRILAHGTPPCLGSGYFIQPPDDPAFNEVVADVVEQIAEEEAGDWTAMAHRAVEEHLTACFDAVECEAKACTHAEGYCPKSPAHSPFDGCVTCIARESIIVSWEFIAEAESEEVVAWLMERADGAPYKVGEMIVHLAHHIANGDHRDEGDDDSGDEEAC